MGFHAELIHYPPVYQNAVKHLLQILEMVPMTCFYMGRSPDEKITIFEEFSQKFTVTPELWNWFYW